jgi:acetoin utilization deacetylase AcuC-like enzyme
MFYGSTHERDNYPGTGIEPLKKGEKSEYAWQRRIVNRQLSTGPASVKEFYKKWREIIAEMIEFGPGLVIISAGFDAHRDDPLGGVSLHESDFAWATRTVLQACDEIGRCNNNTFVPCISILEGGYNLDAISRSAAAHVKVLFSEREDDLWQIQYKNMTSDTNSQSDIVTTNVVDENDIVVNTDTTTFEDVTSDNLNMPTLQMPLQTNVVNYDRDFMNDEDVLEILKALEGNSL